MVVQGIFDTRQHWYVPPVGRVFEFATNHQCSAESEGHCQEKFLSFFFVALHVEVGILWVLQFFKEN
jgi:hypothetical protein